MKALLSDWGLFPELALRLAREIGDVGYFSPWASAFPNPRDQLVGAGLEEFGVQRIDFPFELFGSVDDPETWIFPDLFFTDWQSMLRGMGRRVWGSGWGELMELDRWRLHTLLEKEGWPIAETEQIEGVDRLLSRLQADPGEMFVKLTPYSRGATETYQHRGWPSSRTWYDNLRHELGPMGDTTSFMIQKAIPGKHVVEPGADLIIRNGRILFPACIGYERKGSALVSRVIDELPTLLAGPIETVIGSLGAEYSNFFSAELRVNEHGEAFFIDATTRAPRPGDAANYELWSNLGAIMTGSDESPIPAAKYCVQLMLDSSDAEKRPLHIQFPEEERAHIKLYQFYRDREGAYWSLPRGITNIASVCAVGDDLMTIQQECLDLAKEVKFDSVSYEQDAFKHIMDDIEQGIKNGVEF